MRRYLNRWLGRATNPQWASLDRTADEFALPRMWIICPHCGSQSWRLPPHGLNEPCPIIAQIAQSTGLKADAERSTAIRMGVQMEEMTRRLREMLPEEEDDE